jgi:hypothetical protein
LDLIFLILGSGRYIKTDLPLGSIMDGIMILTLAIIFQDLGNEWIVSGITRTLPFYQPYG